MDIFLFIMCLFFAVLAIYYKNRYDNNNSYFEVPLNEVLIAARENESDMDKIGLAASQINEVNLNNVDNIGLVIYRQWLYGEFLKVKKVIKNKRKV